VLNMRTSNKLRLTIYKILKSEVFNHILEKFSDLEIPTSLVVIPMAKNSEEYFSLSRDFKSNKAKESKVINK